ncbi:ribosomal L7Ae/L30e/S12e/Gadd45 family protein [Clostridium sp. YIM B02515]|uniref:Ribosomal L7Ae/L30e/S12e/Gadd45 family protein n=1 Tax=Clostridium rhizosphaerae TaxID=2803861 RepID=A0ABS1TJA7_9CLOT|nr:ribosomal L7Ae/L30e/S12e/Gadd45 family protein [Clostridium rhizosphaerae]MBL4938646.1 ribosomal L7Ae/L30e/S12e/Gadd45 family protein [Clostridium rhizosphaerae]
MVERLLGKKVVGIKQSLKAINNDEVKSLYVASDADIKLIEPVLKLAQQNSLEINYVKTMKDLGKLCGIDVGAATAVLLKD